MAEQTVLVVTESDDRVTTEPPGKLDFDLRSATEFECDRITAHDILSSP